MHPDNTTAWKMSQLCAFLYHGAETFSDGAELLRCLGLYLRSKKRLLRAPRSHLSVSLETIHDVHMVFGYREVMRALRRFCIETHMTPLGVANVEHAQSTRGRTC